MKQTGWTSIPALALALSMAASGPAAGALVGTSPTPGDGTESGSEATVESLEPTALAVAAAETGVSASSLEVAASAPAVYTELGQKLFVYKIDSRDGRTVNGHHVTLDATGAVVDAARLAEIELAERQAELARYGKIDPALAARMAPAARGALFDVVVWVQESLSTPQVPAPGSPTNPPSPGEIAGFYAQVDAQRAATVAAALEAVNDPERVKALSEEAGCPIELTAERYAPALRGRTCGDGAARLAGAFPAIERIYGALPAQQHRDPSTPGAAVRAGALHALGLVGTGVRVAQVEVGGRVEPLNPFLTAVTQEPRYICASASPHSTAVAGILGRPFLAPEAQVWAGGSCFGILAQLRELSDLAAEGGASILNLSWGTTSFGADATARFYDDMVRYRRRSVVVSAGNRGQADALVGSPGTSYNVITVGSADDGGTPGWADDVMSPTSSWRGPDSRRNDRQKPEVVAPGVSMTSTLTQAEFIGTGSWLGGAFTGTSFAAPTVAGGAALLVQRHGGLATSPEALKAVLLASAANEVDELSGLPSDKDGAGGVALDRALGVVDRTAGGWGTATLRCADPHPTDVATFSAVAGRRVRVAIAWSTDPDAESYEDQPSADLDLVVNGPDGRRVARSTSFDNTYEVTELVPQVTGLHVIRVRHRPQRCDADPGTIAWAWSAVP